MPDEILIDPEIAAVLAEFPLDLGGLSDETLTAIREGMADGPLPELSDAVAREDHQVPAAGADPAIVVRVHRPMNGGDNLGCLYWMHSGGLVLGSYAAEEAGPIPVGVSVHVQEAVQRLYSRARIGVSHASGD